MFASPASLASPMAMPTLILIASPPIVPAAIRFLALFTGTHHVTITAQAYAANGVGSLHVESVMFDGVEIPRLALEYFADRYLRPRYGNAVGLDSTFHLPSRVDTAILGNDQVTITQR